MFRNISLIFGQTLFSEILVMTFLACTISLVISNTLYFIKIMISLLRCITNLFWRMEVVVCSPASVRSDPQYDLAILWVMILSVKSRVAFVGQPSLLMSSSRPIFLNIVGIRSRLPQDITTMCWKLSRVTVVTVVNEISVGNCEKCLA